MGLCGLSQMDEMSCQLLVCKAPPGKESAIEKKKERGAALPVVATTSRKKGGGCWEPPSHRILSLPRFLRRVWYCDA
jgi:hypothetical protein